MSTRAPLIPQGIETFSCIQHGDYGQHAIAHILLTKTVRARHYCVFVLVMRCENVCQMEPEVCDVTGAVADLVIAQEQVDVLCSCGVVSCRVRNELVRMLRTVLLHMRVLEGVRNVLF